MASTWEKVYPERINWQNRPATTTPINDINLNKIDSALRIIDDRVYDLGYTKTFDLLASKWTTNGDDYYPYLYTISTTDYTTDSAPDAAIYTASGTESETEHAAIDSIGKVWCDSSGVKVYATSKPSMNLKLQLKGR